MNLKVCHLDTPLANIWAKREIIRKNKGYRGKGTIEKCSLDCREITSLNPDEATAMRRQEAREKKLVIFCGR